MKKVILFIFIAFLNIKTYAIYKEKKSLVIVDIVILNHSIVNANSIKFEIFKDGVNSDNYQQNDIFYLKNSSNRNRLSIPISSEATYGIVSYQYNYRNIVLNKQFLLLFEKGDHIRLSIKNDVLKFTGKGSDKYNCMSEISLQNMHFSSQKENSSQDLSAYESFIFQKRGVDSLFNIRMGLLKRYRKRLHFEIYQLILADIWSEYNSDLLSIIYNPIITVDGKRSYYDKDIERAYYDLFTMSELPELSNAILAKSYRYCDFLYNKEKFFVLFFSIGRPGYYKYEYTFKDIYDQIQKKYSGEIKDKVSLIAFYRGSKSRKDVSLFYGDCINKMTDTKFRNSLIRLKNNTTGKAYPFELPNDKGIMIRLNDFKGKLLVMDFWFSGCKACHNLYTIMKPIINTYKSNPNIVFVSVSIDKNKNTWLKSVNEEVYTSKDEVNLYTAGLGKEHPLIKHYSILSYPFIMIISKEGEIITTEPPRPRQTIPGSIEDFKNFLSSKL